MNYLTTEDINGIVERQLACWPMAKRNFDALTGAERKELPLGDLKACAQFNPGRIKSTAAKVDPLSIKARECFLCASNRPTEQEALKWIDGWDLLVNPYPILPIHFTIVDTRHTPQSEIPFEMAEMAEKAPDLAIFFNGARAGASAPDHRHCQGVLKAELPLLSLAEKAHSPEMPPLMSSEDFGLDLPFHFLSAVIKPSPEGMKTLVEITGARGIDASTGVPDPALVNAFFWIDSRGYLRVIVIPRKAHRPACFYEEGEGKLTASPGALDMAGMLILPVYKDFQAITPDIARKIYAETAFADSLPEEVLRVRS